MDKKAIGKFAVVGLALIILLGFIFLVSALTSDERQSLNDELNNLTAELNSQGYSWLTNYLISYSSVEVYRENGNDVIAKFENVLSENWYKIYLTNLSEGESRDVFDLKVLGQVEFDYIVDPDWIEISACGTISGDSILIQDIPDASGTCFSVEADNVDFDMNGHTITGDTTGSGFYVLGNYFNVFNGNITNFDVGIFVDEGGSPTIEDMNVSNNREGIFLYGSSYGIYTNITANSNSGTGINVNDGSSFNTLTNITANNNGNYGIYIYSEYNNLNNITANSNGGGIHLYVGGHSTLNQVTASSNQYYGISLDHSSNNNLTNVIASNNAWGDGIYLFSSSNNILTGIIVDDNYNQGYGIYLLSSSNNKLNQITANRGKYPVYLQSSSGNTFTALTISGYTDYGLRLSSSSNNKFIDSSIFSYDYDISFIGDSINNTLLNTTGSEITPGGSTIGAGCQLIKKWYYQAFVNDTLGNFVSGANVTAYNVSDNYHFSLLTDETGYTSQTEIIDYINNAGVITYYSPYNITATNSSYTPSLISHTIDVTVLHNVNDVFTFTTVSDSIAPNVTIIYPVNGTAYSSSSMTFNITAVDDTGISSCWYSLTSGAVNYSMSNTTASAFNATNSSIADGSYTAKFYCNDTSNNLNNSEQVTFIIDITAPAVSIVYPANTTYNTNVSSLNYTSDGVNCWYSLNNGVINSTPVTCGTNWTELTSIEGSNTWSVYANDSVGNLNSSSVTFFKDTIVPVITISSPLNQTYNTNSILINFTADSYQSLWYYNGSANRSYTSPETITASQGSNIFIFYANDSAGNLNSSSITFFVDSVAPLINFGFGTSVDYANLSQANVYVNTTWTETNLANITFSLYNSTSTVNSTTYTTPTYLINFTNLIDNNYTYEVNITDTANNKNSTGVRNIRLDTTKPLISYSTDTLNDSSRVRQTNIYVNVSLTETNFKNITFNLYYSNNTAINTTTYTTAVYTINWTNLSGEDYKHNVSVYDTAGNTNSTATRTITLITSESNITLNSGWNLISLPMKNIDTGTDRNISLVAGWNLIGYNGAVNTLLSNALFNNGSNSYTWVQALTKSKAQAYLAYYDNNAQDNLTQYKYMSTISGLDDTAFRQNKGYWLYANSSGNLTLPAVGGTLGGETYEWSKLRFSNGTMELGIVEASNNTYRWVESGVKYWGYNDLTGRWGFIDIFDDSTPLNSWDGYFIKSLKDNITLVRQN